MEQTKARAGLGVGGGVGPGSGSRSGSVRLRTRAVDRWRGSNDWLLLAAGGENAMSLIGRACEEMGKLRASRSPPASNLCTIADTASNKHLKIEHLRLQSLRHRVNLR